MFEELQVIQGRPTHVQISSSWLMPSSIESFNRITNGITKFEK